MSENRSTRTHTIAVTIVSALVVVVAIILIAPLLAQDSVFRPPLTPFQTYLALFLLVLGAFDFFLGERKLRQAQERGLYATWYRQPEIVTSVGIGLYILYLLVGYILPSFSSSLSSSFRDATTVIFAFFIVGVACYLVGLLFWKLKRER